MSSKNIYGKPLADSTGGEYDSYHRHYVHGLPNSKAADDCTDQLPLFSAVGRGIAGNSYRVTIKSDSDNATYLAGESYDAATKEWSEDWNSENLNGGHLDYTYTQYTDTIPFGFTITFTYTRPGRVEWEWTTPLIPFIAMTEEEARYYYAQGLSKILSVPVENLVWLLEQDKEITYEGTDYGSEGIEGHGCDMVDWVKDYAIEDWFMNEDNQQKFVNEIIKKIQENTQKITYASPKFPLGDNTVAKNYYTLDWVALVDKFSAQNMFKIYTTGFEMATGDGNEVDLCTWHDPDKGGWSSDNPTDPNTAQYEYAEAEMLPAYGNLDIPIANAISVDGDPVTIFLICEGLSEDGSTVFDNDNGHTEDQLANPDVIGKCRFLLKARLDGNIKTDTAVMTKPFFVSNSVVYYNNYTKEGRD